MENFNDVLFNSIEKVITSNFKIESEVSNDLRRALLTIEVDNKYEFYNYWESSWNVISSEKRRLIDRFREIEYIIYCEYREYFKRLILKLIDNNLTEIIDNFNAPEGFPNWKNRLIKEKDLLDEKCPSNLIAIPRDSNCCYLLKSKRPRDINGCIEII